MKRILILCFVCCFVLVFSVLIMLLHQKQHPYTHITQHVSTKGDYVVFEIHGVLSKQECGMLRSRAISKGLTDSQVWSYKTLSGNTLDGSHRKSKQTWLAYDCAASKKLSDLSVFLTGIPTSHQETLQVAMYEVLGKFNAHHDACYNIQVNDTSYCDTMNKHSGQRKSTLLVYLNDDFQGGETEFVDCDIKIRPKAGNAILFFNTHEDESIIQASKHRGCPVLTGEKWIATVWSHSKPYNTT